MKYVVTRAGCFNFLCDAEYILLILQNPWTQWSRVWAHHPEHLTPSWN